MTPILNPGETPQITLESVAGELVHVVASGPEDGPPLLLSSGLGGAWFDWKPTVDLLEKRYRVLNFDRPGLGMSPLGHAAPSLRRDVRILAGLAEIAAERAERAGRPRGPVTVVAHSVAGFHAEALARLHPELVGALVLVDPSWERDPRAPVRLANVMDPVAKAIGAGLGFTRLSRIVGPLGRRMIMRYASDRDEPVPADVVRTVYGRGTVLGTVLAEDFAYRETAVDLAGLRERRPFPPIPLVVLTALAHMGRSDEARDYWREGHRRLAEMSPHGRQIVLPEARHMLQLDRPEAVADAVAEVLG